MKRSYNIFFNQKDEKEFSSILKKEIPEILFVDGCYWPTPEPPLCSSIDGGKEDMVYLWNPLVAETLPSRKHSDKIRYHGPQAGIVIQFLRCRKRDSILKNGCISAGISDSNDLQSVNMKNFSQKVWKILNRFCVSGLAAVSPDSNEVLNKHVPKFKLGPNAAEWCKKESYRYFRDSTIYNYYRIF